MLQINPNDPIAPYLMAAAKGDGAAPSASPREYVVELFDRYADRFESSLVGELEYRIPQHIQAAINALHHDTKPLEILDLGCGTGLCGRLLRDRASRLVGVDLSKNMVEKTRATGIYDEVRQAELTDALQQARESWDLIVAADVFVYVGELSTVFETCRAALRPGGLFAFSVEAAESDNGWKLRESARYAHSLDYIRGLAQRHAMTEKYLEHVAVRKEHNANIAGMVFVLEKPTS